MHFAQHSVFTIAVIGKCYNKFISSVRSTSYKSEILLMDERTYRRTDGAFTLNMYSVQSVFFFQIIRNFTLIFN